MIKHWLHAFRLRTLPLAIASVVMGSTLAFIYDVNPGFGFQVFVLALLTAIELQILSNLANDYGDYTKGTDNEQRIGTTRALQAGHITPEQMKRMMWVFVILSLITGISLIRISFPDLTPAAVLLFIVGLAAIGAAIKYTVGSMAYGYRGLGDVAVFFFFGWFAVLGTAYVLIHQFRWAMLAPASAMGFLATAVLNVNNIRDIDNDKACGKITIPVRLGVAAAKKYHVFLISAALILALGYAIAKYSHWIGLAFILSYPLIIYNTIQVWQQPPSPAYNRLLKNLSLSILVFVLLYAVSFGLSFIFYLGIIGQNVLY